MRWWTAAAVVVTAALVGCVPPASDSADPAAVPSSTPSVTSSVPVPSATSTTREHTGTKVIVGRSEFGPMLYGSDGQAIYLFDLEDSSVPRCYGDCASAWPPVLTKGRPTAGRGVAAGLLGVSRRKDGSTQVTYAGHPLYFYAHEEQWQVLCHDFADFGGTWFVVRPGGDAAA